MTSPRYLPKDYEFTLRLLNQGTLLSSPQLGVMIAFSSVDELCRALTEFNETGKGVIGKHLRKANVHNKRNNT